MYIHATQLRVRYVETDPMGYVYYGNYAQYFEVARVEMLRSLGLTYKDMEAIHGVLMPVMSLSTRYVRPALYDDLLTIETTLRVLPSAHIIFYTEIFNEAKKLLCGGEVKLCFIDKNTRKRVETPQHLMEKLVPFF